MDSLLQTKKKMVRTLRKKPILVTKVCLSIVGIICIIFCYINKIQSGILYDMSIGIVSSMILVWCIDEVILREEKKNEIKKHSILYRRIKPLLREYYDSYLYLYIYTSEKTVQKDDKVLYSLYSCKDDFVRQINKAEPFYKPGYYVDINVINKIFNMNPNEINEQNKPIDDSIKVYKCISKGAKKFYDGMDDIEKNFAGFFPYDLLLLVENLMDNVKMTKNLDDFIELRTVKDLGLKPKFFTLPDYIEFPTEFLINESKYLESLGALERVIEYIEKDDDSIDLRYRNVDFFNNRNTKPIIGDAYK